MLDISKYKSLVFDCDGVILNSNKIKTNAFYKTALPYGEISAKDFVEYHVKNGGISRYKKFEYFLTDILKVVFEEDLCKSLIDVYANFVVDDLLQCKIADNLSEIRRSYNKKRWLVVSGGDQNELRKVFSSREISQHFDGGIFGSPDKKELILSREIENGNIIEPALFLGDSYYDFYAASTVGMDFVFVSGWTEYKTWESLQDEHGFPVIEHISDLLT